MQCALRNRVTLRGVTVYSRDGTLNYFTFQLAFYNAALYRRRMVKEKVVTAARRAAAALLVWVATFVYRHSAMGRTLASTNPWSNS